MKKVATNTIDAGLLAKMFLAGAKNLEVKKEWINELNVFPVPDGDTGTNMTLTIMSAVKEVNSLTEVNMYNLSKAISSGSLRGLRNIAPREGTETLKWSYTFVKVHLIKKHSSPRGDGNPCSVT